MKLDEAGAIFTCSSALCAGTAIRGCDFRGSLARGIRLQTIDALIEGNTISRTMGFGLTFAGHPGFWGEATDSRNVTVRNNTFAETCGADRRSSRAAIVVGTDGDKAAADLVRDIRIESNTIVRCGGSAVLLDGCRRVSILNNVIRQWGMLPSAPFARQPPESPGYGLPILNLSSEGALVTGNRFQEPGPNAQQPSPRTEGGTPPTIAR